MFANLDLRSLSVDDIVEEYKLLHDRHQQLKEQSEEDAQRIYELKRSLDTALAAEKYLTQELEQLSSQPAVGAPSPEHQELEELRRRFKSLQAEQDALQQDHDSRSEEVRLLRDKLEAAERSLAEKASSRAGDDHEECQVRLGALERENCDLMQKLADYEDSSVKNTFAVAEKEKTIECLQDQVSCLEQNLHCKRDELEEKLQLLESCQEQLVDANAKIALLTSAPENNDRKGNSLFAEVDDQRQVMKQLLANQKKSYLEMKKTYTESQYEIRRLKRENVAMHNELQACSTIFCSADKTYRNKLNERIRQLMAENDSLERQVNVSQERLRELASEKSVTWLDSMLDFCKSETDELKVQLRSMRIQKAGLEEQVRSLQQEMVRWRFESLKSRCVLIDRENLLTEQNIAFKPMQAMEFNIKEAEQKAALPRIASVSTESLVVASKAPVTKASALSTPTEIVNLVTPMKPEKKDEEMEPLKAANPPSNGSPLMVKQELPEAQRPVPVATHMGVKIKREVQTNTDPEPEKEIIDAASQETPVECIKTDCDEGVTEEQEIELDDVTSPVKPVQKGTPVKPRLGAIKVKSDEELLFKPPTPAKPLRKGTPVKLVKMEALDQDSEDESAKAEGTDAIQIPDSPTPQKPQRNGTPIRNAGIKDATNKNVRSILSKKRDIFGDDCHKNVQFSALDPIVHNLSPVDRLLTPKENEKPAASEDNKDIKPTIKKPVVIRRRIVSARKPTLP
ncbi:hypothetical protein KR018_006198 [Drosophila ironensis]|nr:hypothetical protein KR018_006198 [Drosophila ironensis]